MEKKQGKIVLFPKWKEELEKESLTALKNKQYEVALSKLEQLIAYNIDNQEIMIGKVICLMELGKKEEAQEFNLRLIEKKDAGYYQYVHIYLTNLFQSHQYKELIEVVDLELENDHIPNALKEQYIQLYEVSKNMYENIKKELFKKQVQKFNEAFRREDFRKQFAIIQQMRFDNLEPNNKIRSLLMQESAHPVIKTVIFKWLIEMDYKESVTISKFGQTLELSPKIAVNIDNNLFLKAMKELIVDIEQENPILYDTIVEILKRFIYVTYPLDLQAYNLNHFLTALLKVAHYSYDSIDEKSDIDKINTYMKEINMSQILYLSIIDE